MDSKRGTNSGFEGILKLQHSVLCTQRSLNTRQRNLTKLVIFLICITWLISPTDATTSLGETIFYDKPYGTKVFPPSSNVLAAFPTYTMPKNAGGQYIAANSPTLDKRGIHITHNTWVEGDSKYGYSGPDNDQLFGIWFYHISGYLGKIVDVDIDFNQNDGFITLNDRTSSSSFLKACVQGQCEPFGSRANGWNCVIFGIENKTFIVGKYTDGSPYSHYHPYSSVVPIASFANNIKLGCSDCSDTSAEYIIHSLKLSTNDDVFNSNSHYQYYGITNSYLSVTVICGDGVKDGSEGCDDDNIADGDGCSSSCQVETGYSCTGGGFSTADTCSDDCGDGKTVGSVASTYCDDGNQVSNDGCSSTCQIESGYTCTGGSSTTADTCTEDCGDGLVMGTVSASYCDDGNTVGGDGCSSTCQVETGYSCTGGSSSSADTCSDNCGDGITIGSVSASYCDDGNTADNDGCSSTCQVETGYECSGGGLTTSDTCSEICGDGIIISNIAATYCDDGNSVSGDGCSSTCQIESGYTCTGASPSSADICTDYCGDGSVHGTVAATYCDDGNLASLDGCSSTCQVETGYECSGGSPVSADTCSEICGDGVIISIVSATYCDDGNSVNGDGCSSICQVETGFACSGGSSSSPDTCSDNCGDGLVYGTVSATYCDDGNSVNGDGCSSICQVETGYACTGGSTSTSDTCLDDCGDGFIYGTVPSTYCDDGNSVSSDGCSSSCQIETGYACTGGSSSSADTCSDDCGDGFTYGTVPTTYCDDGNQIDGDGCSSTCHEETGFACTGGSTSSADTCADNCGDGLLYGTVTATRCDDGNLNDGDGCSSLCQVETGYACTGGSTTTSSTCADDCGDGFVYGSVSASYCDDGNQIDNDGCSSSCQVELGYMCTSGSPTTSSVCSDICGDGTIYGLIPSTYCDDGNDVDGDGCNATCDIEPGYSCTVISLRSECDICGNGIIFPSEGCDDANVAIGDGCDQDCQIESGYKCTLNINDVSACYLSCSDGVLDSGEQCDDSNAHDSDGCNSLCQFESGYTCTGEPSYCVPDCGNGSRDSGEECDDNNNLDNDGCSKTCEIEDHYTCVPGSSGFDVCTSLYNPPIVTSSSGDYITEKVQFEFNETMKATELTNDDVSVEFTGPNSPYTVSWTFNFESDTVLEFSYSVTPTPIGGIGEELTINLINLDKFRSIYNIAMENTASETVEYTEILADAEAEKAGQGASYSFLITVGISVGISVITGGSMELMWSLTNTLQIIFYLSMMSILIPSNLATIMMYLSYSNFDNPLTAWLFKVMFSGVFIISSSVSSKFEGVGLKSENILVNSLDKIFLLILFIITVCVSALLYRLVRDQDNSCARGIRKVDTWLRYEPIHRFIVEISLSMFVATLVNITYGRDFSSPITTIAFTVAIILVVFMISIMAYTIIFPLVYQKRLITHPDFNERHCFIFLGFKKDNIRCLMYYAYFMMRRMLLAFVLVCLPDFPHIQCVCVLLLCFWILLYHVQYLPYDNKLINFLSCFNEMILVCFTSLLFFFLDTDDQHKNDIVGYVCIGLIFIFFTVNWCIIFPIKFVEFYRKIKSWFSKKEKKPKKKKKIDASEIDPKFRAGEFMSDKEYNAQIQITKEYGNKMIEESKQSVSMRKTAPKPQEITKRIVADYSHTTVSSQTSQAPKRQIKERLDEEYYHF